MQAILQLSAIRQALNEQGWQLGRSVTVLSDGYAALPGLIRAAVGEPGHMYLGLVAHLDARPAYRERLAGRLGLRPRHHGGFDLVAMRIDRLRHLIWNGYHQEARNELFGMRHLISEVAYMNGDAFRPAVARLLWNCHNLSRYLANNTSSLIDYGERYRSKLPISTSRAEACVDEIANARMATKQLMRWNHRARIESRPFALPCLMVVYKSGRTYRSLRNRPGSFHSQGEIIGSVPDKYYSVRSFDTIGSAGGLPCALA